MVQIKRRKRNSKRSVNESRLCNLNNSEVLNLHIKDPVLAPERLVAMEWEDAALPPKLIVKLIVKHVEKERKPKAENKIKPNT